MSEEWINIRIPKRLKDELEKLKVHRRQAVWEIISELFKKAKVKKKEGGK